MVMQPTLVSNPFGTLPAMPQMSIGNGGSSPSIQYGISSLPVSIYYLLAFLVVSVQAREGTGVLVSSLAGIT